MSKKKKNSVDLDSQLKYIDPLPQNFEAPHESLLHRAAASASSSPAKRAMRLNPLKLTTALGATAMVIVVGVFFSTALAPTAISSSSLAAKDYPATKSTPGNLENDFVMMPGSATGGSKVTSIVGRPAIDAGGDPILNPTLVITIGEAGSNTNAAASTNAPKLAAGAGLASDSSTSTAVSSSMVKCVYFWGGGCGWRKTEYKAADTLSNKPGTAQVYKIESKGDPKSTAADIATVLGLSLPVEAWTDEWSKQTNYFVGANPTTEGAWQKASLLVYAAASGNYWYYYDNNAYAWPECVPVVTVNADGTKTDEGYCVSEPVKDSKAPGQVRATDLARVLFNKLGYPVVTSAKGAKDNSVILSYQSDDWGSSVTANLVVDQQLTTVSWYLYWNAITGQLVTAGGSNVVASSAGTFSTISATDAFKRVSTWQWQGSFYTDNNFNWGSDRPYPEYTPVCPVPLDWQVKSDVVVEPVPADTVSVDPATPPTVDPVVDPQPCVENPPVQVITVNSSKNVLLQLWDDQQTQWLVPGFLYFDDYGYAANAISLPDGVIKLPENLFITY
ncbi:MAG: hypothetical protein ACKORF_04365 [Micrococcales bacterium]